jgi:hypothetical protein
MVLNSKKIFGNYFDDRKIIPNNLARFADDVVAKLKQNNTNGDYDALIDAITTTMIPFRSELGQVDTAFNILVGKTATVDSFIFDFKEYMKDNYVYIAAALEGEKSAAFGEFYPHGKTEYSIISKTKIPTVMDRLKTVGAKYKTQLGDAISTKLQEFQTTWNDLREEQLEGKSAVKTNRSDRSVARRAVEIELLKTIHFIGNKFPGDVVKCMLFFDFNLLFSVHHSSSHNASTATS